MFPAFKPLPKVHDCTLLLPRKGRAPYLVGCVAEIAIGLVRCLCARETGKKVNLWLFEIASLFVRLDHVAGVIVNANHSIVALEIKPAEH